MNFAIVRYLIGWLMGIESLFLLLPAFTAVIYREPELPAYIATALICMVGAGILCEYKPKNTKFYAREGFVAVSAVLAGAGRDRRRRSCSAARFRRSRCDFRAASGSPPPVLLFSAMWRRFRMPPCYGAV